MTLPPMYAHLHVGMFVTFDVRGFRRGEIVRIYEVNGVTYCHLVTRRRGGIEHFPRVGLPRINVLTDNGAST